MKQLSLYCCLEVSPPAVISFYGAGGKTTLMRKLASEMLSSGQKVLITTTTKIYPYQDLPFFLADDTKKAADLLRNHYANHDLAVLGRNILPDGKLEGFVPAEVESLFDKLQVSIIVEADGARGMPIKGYADNEPVIPSCSDLIIPVIGADALYSSLSPSGVHRLQDLLQVTGNDEGATITENIIAETFKYMLDLGKKQASQSEAICILNKVDLLEVAGPKALKIANLLSVSSETERFLVTRAENSNPVKIIFNTDSDKNAVNVSCVVLAAGRSSRMGTDKLLLTIKGKTILEYTLESIVNAEIEDIIVIIKPESNWPEIIGKHKCKLIVNPHYRSGLSTSLKAGLSSLNKNTQGVIFALGDQPHVSADTYKLLINNYRNNLKLITCPRYRGQRGNPTIFDRRTWPDLFNIRGDRGGRSLYNSVDQSEIDQVDTIDPGVLIDLDTPEDYKKFLNSSKA